MEIHRSQNGGRHGSGWGRGGFTFLEVVTALTILAIVSSSVLVVVKRCMAAVADTSMKMQALDVARENMESLLASNSVKDGVEFGQSEKYPDITWETNIESFYEPVTNRMWVQAVCLAEYTDSNDLMQSVELTHWITNVSKGQLMQILDEQDREQAMLDAEGGIDTDGDGVPDMPAGGSGSRSGSGNNRSGGDSSSNGTDSSGDGNDNNNKSDSKRARGGGNNTNYPWEKPGGENMTFGEIWKWLEDNGRL